MTTNIHWLAYNSYRFIYSFSSPHYSRFTSSRLSDIFTLNRKHNLQSTLTVIIHQISERGRVASANYTVMLVMSLQIRPSGILSPMMPTSPGMVHSGSAQNSPGAVVCSAGHGDCHMIARSVTIGLFSADDL